MMASFISNRFHNRLLRCVPPDELDHFDDDLEVVQLCAGDVLVIPGANFEHVHFIEQGMAVVTMATTGGRFLEVSQIGSEGMVGVSAILGSDETPLRTVVQISGVAHRLALDRLANAMDECPSLRSTMLRYAHVCMVQIADAATSLGRFTVTQRLARWILMAHDRSEEDTLFITHERLAALLDVRRSGVTDAVALLEGDGMIRGYRSHICVRDRQKLRARAGNSYGRAEDLYRRILYQPQAVAGD